MVNEATARGEVERIMACWRPKPNVAEDEFVVWNVEEHSRAWILHFATRRWIASRSFSDLTVGACPFVVDKTTGDVHVYGSAPSEYDKFKAWLDDDNEPR